MTEPISSDSPENEMEQSVGERLREAREAKQLELRDVALKTRQSQETLAALESEQTDHIPASILRLQARNYARFLGLPEADIVSAFAQDRSSINTQSMPSQTSEFQFPTRALVFGGGALASLVLLAGAVTLFASAPSPSAEDSLAISARLAPAFDHQAGLSSLKTNATEEFSIRALEAAWIEVRGSDGTVFRSRQMKAGETYFPRMGAGWTITVRNAGAFEWQLGDAPVGVIGDPEQALFSVSVDDAHEAALLARSPALADAGDNQTGRR